MLLVSTYPDPEVLFKKDPSPKEAVKRIQEKLNKQGYRCNVDSVFTEETETQVKNFQQNSGLLAVDGIVGPLTWEKLFEELPQEEPSEQTMKEAQKGKLEEQVNQAVIGGFDHYYGYKSEENTAKVFKIVNNLVNQRMKEHFANTDCLEGVEKLSLTPQLWRTFESEVHLIPPLEEKIAQAGVFRKDLGKDFQPEVK